MIRERLSRAVAVVVVAALVALSVLFAEAHNRPQTSEPDPGETVASQDTTGPGAPRVDTTRARALFTELGCGGCHAVGSLGNPRIPLDRIGSRRTPASIRAWTIGEEAVADSISPGILRVKRAWTDLPEPDLAVLVAWLAGLKE